MPFNQRCQIIAVAYEPSLMDFRFCFLWYFGTDSPLLEGIGRRLNIKTQSARRLMDAPPAVTQWNEIRWNLKRRWLLACLLLLLSVIWGWPLQSAGHLVDGRRAREPTLIGPSITRFAVIGSHGTATDHGIVGPTNGQKVIVASATLSLAIRKKNRSSWEKGWKRKVAMRIEWKRIKRES